MKQSRDPTPSQGWAIYSRVSTEEQAQKGVSLEAQVRSCRAMLEAHGYALVEVYEDAGLSAKDLNRPALQRLLADAEAGRLAGVVVWKLDRLSRSTRDLLDTVERLNGWRVSLLSVHEKIDTGGAGGRFTLTLLGALAQLEREQTSERVRAVIRHKRGKGEFCGGYIPPGLRSVGDTGHRRLEVDPVNGPLVAQAWGRVIGGATLLDVAEWLTASGVATSSAGSRWQKGNTSRLLTQEAYIGLLVDLETFHRCRAVLETRYAPIFGRTGGDRATCHPNTDRVWLLQGLARCARCGSALVGSCHGRNRLPYLRCSGRTKRGREFCSASNIPAATYERLAVEEVAKEIGAGTELAEAITIHLAELRARSAPALQRRGAIELERDDLQRRIEAILTLVEQGGASAVEARQRLEPLAQRKQTIVLALAEMDGLAASIQASQHGADSIMATLRGMADGLLELPAARQRAVLRNLVEAVVIERGRSMTITLAIPDPLKRAYPPVRVGMPVSDGDLDGT